MKSVGILGIGILPQDELATFCDTYKAEYHKAKERLTSVVDKVLSWDHSSCPEVVEDKDFCSIGINSLNDLKELTTTFLVYNIAMERLKNPHINFETDEQGEAEEVELESELPPPESELAIITRIESNTEKIKFNESKIKFNESKIRFNNEIILINNIFANKCKAILEAIHKAEWRLKTMYFSSIPTIAMTAYNIVRFSSNVLSPSGDEQTESSSNVGLLSVSANVALLFHFFHNVYQLEWGAPNLRQLAAEANLLEKVKAAYKLLHQIETGQQIID